MELTEEQKAELAAEAELEAQAKETGAELSAELQMMVDTTAELFAAQLKELNEKLVSKIESVEEMLAAKTEREGNDWDFYPNYSTQDAEGLCAFVLNELKLNTGNSQVGQALSPTFAKNDKILEALYDGASDSVGDIMKVKYFNMISDLVNRYGVAREVFTFDEDAINGEVTGNWLIATGVPNAKFLLQGDNEAFDNERVYNPVTQDKQALAAYAFITQLAAGMNRINFVEQVSRDHARGIAFREDWACFMADGTVDVNDGGMTGIVSVIETAASDNFKTIASASLVWDDILDGIAGLPMIFRREQQDITICMPYAVWNTLFQVKATNGTYLYDTVKGDPGFANVMGYKVNFNAEILDGTGTSYIAIVHKSESVKVATGQKKFVIDDKQRANKFQIGIGMYEELAIKVPQATAGYVIAVTDPAS